MADASKWGIYQDVLVQQNTDYTFSIDVNAQLWMECRALTTTTSADGTITPTGIVANSGWDEQFVDNDYNYDNRRYSKTFNTGNYKAYRFFLYGYNLMYGYDTNKASFFNHPQLELGTKATDWTPSPFDSQEKIDETAEAVEGKVERSAVRGAIANNNLFINTEIYDSWFDDLETFTTSTNLPTSFTNWSFYLDENEEISMDGRWDYTILGENEYMYMINLETIITEEEGEEGDILYSNSYLYQDVLLEPNTDYTFSVFAIDDRLPVVSCQALDDNYEVISNTGWDSKDFTWDYVIPDISVPEYKRIYKSFNSGDKTTWRFKISSYTVWVDWGNDYWWWDEGTPYVFINKFQLNKGNTMTDYVDGYWSLSMVKDAFQGVREQVEEIHDFTMDTKELFSPTIQVLRGNPDYRNKLVNSNWTKDTKFYNGVPSQLSLGKWKLDNTNPNYQWATNLLDCTSNYSFTFSDTVGERFDWPYFSFDLPQPAAGECAIAEGGIYQDVELRSNTTYTFSVLLGNNRPSYYSADIGAFIDCKALQYDSSTHTYSVVSNTGFNIQEYPNYSGTKTWTVENVSGLSGVKRVYIQFNSGSYTYYRFRVYSAMEKNSSGLTICYGGFNRFWLDSGNWRYWEYGEEYSLADTYAQAVNICNNLVDIIYPVGSYFETSVYSSNPNWTFPNTTWVLETVGMVHVSGDRSGTNVVFNANNNNGAGEKDGGAATVTLTGAQSGNQALTYVDTTYKLNTTNRKPGTSSAVAYGTSITATANNKTIAAKNATTAHENMPPYINVFRWHRIA